MSAWQYDMIENAQRAWHRAQRDHPMPSRDETEKHRPTRPIMDGRGPQLPGTVGQRP